MHSSANYMFIALAYGCQRWVCLYEMKTASSQLKHPWQLAPWYLCFSLSPDTLLAVVDQERVVNELD